MSAEVAAEVKVESKTEAKTEVKTEAKTEAKSDVQTQVQTAVALGVEVKVESYKSAEPEENSENKEKTPNSSSFLAHLSVSYFGNEKQAAMAWLSFITVYWSVVMWVPTLLRMDFATPGFGLYCVGLIAIFAEGAAIYADYYPSGATKASPNGYKGTGRYSAIFLVICILADIFGLAYTVLNRDTALDEYFRASCHFIALVWCSLFYYNRLLKENPEMAWTVFWEEWVDIVLTIIMILILHKAYSKKHNKTHKACFKSGLCSTYWSVFVVQLSGWMLPMMMIDGWGAEKHATKVSLHLFVLDMCTNVPILIAVVATTGYVVSPAIFFDLLWKACGFARSTAYFMVYYVWLRRGKRTHEPVVEQVKKSLITTKPNI